MRETRSALLDCSWQLYSAGQPHIARGRRRAGPFSASAGELTAGGQPGEFKVASATAIVAVGEAGAADYRLRAELKFAQHPGNAWVRVAPVAENDLAQPAALHFDWSHRGRQVSGGCRSIV